MSRQSVDNSTESVDYTTVFPVVTGGIMEAPNEDGPGGGALTPSVPRSLALDPIQPERTTYMVDETRTPEHTDSSDRERGGLHCLDHFLSGWPGDRDCPCIERMERRARLRVVK